MRGHHHKLERPFFVLATQNPIELEGTYPLPEAQLDRFLFNVLLDYLTADEEVKVVDRYTTRWTSPRSIRARRPSRSWSSNGSCGRCRLAESVERYAVDLVRATRPDDPTRPRSCAST